MELGSGRHQRWVFRLNFMGEKWKVKHIQPYKKGKGLRIMVWAAFWGENWSDLIRLERDFEAKKYGYTAHSYLQLLGEMLPTIWEPGLTFMQDNAPIHSANSVKKWFEEHAIPVMDWPPYSPDLNPIEHLWFPLKEGVSGQDPELDHASGHSIEVEEKLWEALQASWAMIKQGILKHLVKSMDNRVNAVIEAKGWNTRY